MVNILVFGGWFGSRNIGDDALLIGIKNAFEKLPLDVNLVAFSSDPVYTKEVCNVNAIKPRGVKEKIRAYLNSDLVMISGGTPIYDYGHISRFLYHFLLPRLTRKRIVYFGISSKKIYSMPGKILTRIILNGSEFITIREPKTEEILSKIGVKENVILTGDSAFIIEPKSRAHIEKITGTPMIGICPRILSTNYKKHFHDKVSSEDMKSINRMIAKTADHFIKKGYRVYFIPFHTRHYDDDMKAIADITKLMSTHEFLVLEGKHNPLDVLSIIGEMDLVIGMRFHSLVFSAVQNIPMVTINYDTKIEGLMKILGLKEFICNPQDTPSTLINNVENLLSRKREVKKNLKLRVEDIRNSIFLSAREVTDLMRRDL